MLMKVMEPKIVLGVGGIVPGRQMRLAVVMVVMVVMVVASLVPNGAGSDDGDGGGQPGLQPGAGCHGARARNALLAPGHEGNVIYQYSPLLETCACDTLLS